MSSRMLVMTASDIQELRENVRQKLSKFSDFQLYETLTLMLVKAEREHDLEITQCPHQAMETPARPPDRPYLLTTPDQKERIVVAAKEYFQNAMNAPTTMRHLVSILRFQGIEVPGQNPGTTLGAIISNHPDFEFCDKRKGLWRLNSKAYSQEATAEEAVTADNQAP